MEQSPFLAEWAAWWRHGILGADAHGAADKRIYMGDSRSQSLTYVTVGDPGHAELRWGYLFAQAGVLNHDTQISAALKVLGGIGMFAVVAWLIWRVWRIVAEGARRPASFERPSALYLVFLGQGKRCMIEAGALTLEAENVSDQSTRWFCLRLKPPAS
jgi:hypothetical protein